MKKIIISVSLLLGSAVLFVLLAAFIQGNFNVFGWSIKVREGVAVLWGLFNFILFIILCNYWLIGRGNSNDPK
jgi:hypothetical protein